MIDDVNAAKAAEAKPVEETQSAEADNSRAEMVALFGEKAVQQAEAARKAEIAKSAPAEPIDRGSAAGVPINSENDFQPQVPEVPTPAGAAAVMALAPTIATQVPDTDVSLSDIADQQVSNIPSVQSSPTFEDYQEPVLAMDPHAALWHAAIAVKASADQPIIDGEAHTFINVKIDGDVWRRFCKCVADLSDD